MAVVINYQNMCRICLYEGDLCDILLLGETTIQWIKDIKTYYNIQISFHDQKSTKLCCDCIQKIEMWRMDVQGAAESQLIINFLDKVAQEREASERRNT